MVVIDFSQEMLITFSDAIAPHFCGSSTDLIKVINK
jgi:hypothetical protein